MVDPRPPPPDPGPPPRAQASSKAPLRPPPDPSGAPPGPGGSGAGVSSDDPFGWVDRVISGYDLDGPRVRMGLLWFVLALLAPLAGMVAVALLFGTVAAAAALQTAAAWRKARRPPHQLVAGLGALALPLAATLGIGATGLTALAFVAAALLAGVVQDRRVRSRRRGVRVPPLDRAATTLRCGFFLGLAAAGAVFLCRTDAGALVTLVVLVSGYEVGDYLVGTGAENPVEGPVAGIATVLVLTFAVAVFQFPPFDTISAWVFGALVAVLAPLGRFAGAVIAPGPESRVPALRRIDSWLIVAPVWAWMLWSYLL